MQLQETNRRLDGFIAARRMMNAAEVAVSVDERRALERAAVRYFWKGCGVDRRAFLQNLGTTTTGEETAVVPPADLWENSRARAPGGTE